MTDKKDEKNLDLITEQERDIAHNALNEFKRKNYAESLQLLAKLEGRSNDLKVALNKAVVELYKNDLKKIDAFQKNLTSIFAFHKIKLDKLDDVEHCTLYYNQAVVLYHQKQYTSALRIMDKVYKFLEPMEENLAKLASLLTIELYFCTLQPDKAATLINYVENQIIGGANKDKDTKKNDSSDDFKKKLQAYKIRCFLMKHNLKGADKELQQFSIKDKMDAHKLILTANFLYLQGNFKESMNLLTRIPENVWNFPEKGESSTVLFYNNLGCLHHAFGKPCLASYYFQMALKEDRNNTKNEESALHLLGGSKYHEIMYNLGISLLYAGRATHAFECLIIAVRRYHRNSRLWLRIAECCIKLHKEGNQQDFNVSKSKTLTSETIGSREKRKIVLTTGLSKDQKYSTQSQDYAVPVPSLEFASLCLRNALNLVPSQTQEAPVPLFLIPGLTPPLPPPSPGPAPSNTLSPNTITSLKNHILITSAYVALCLGDYLMSLEFARTLLEQPVISQNHKLLAHLYAAESLVLQDKLDEASEHLNIELIKDLSFNLPCEEKDLKTSPAITWFPCHLGSAQAVLQYNLAVVKILKGNLEQAGSLLKTIWQQQRPNWAVPAHVILLIIYVELQLGHADNARSLIKQYANQQRLNG